MSLFYEVHNIATCKQNKRGPAVQKSMDQAVEVMQLAHKGYANSQQLFDQFGVYALATAKECCTMIKEQLSKHTNYQAQTKIFILHITAVAHEVIDTQEKLLHAEAEWIAYREREMNRYAQAHEEDQKAMEAQFAEVRNQAHFFNDPHAHSVFACLVRSGAG